MSAADLAIVRLKTEEGFRAHVYVDSAGHQTLGYGLNLDAGLTESAAEALLGAQVSELHENLLAYSWYAGLDAARQSVCLDVSFNAGIHGLLGFPSMIHYLSVGDWVNAAAQCAVKNPQLKSRYDELANIILTGEVAT